jgi:hypothetical protein
VVRECLLAPVRTPGYPPLLSPTCALCAGRPMGTWLGTMEAAPSVRYSTHFLCVARGRRKPCLTEQYSA